jgi:hypothetical protein
VGRDYFTKPLQGALFYKMRDQIINIESTSECHSSAHRSVLGTAEKDEKESNLEVEGVSQGSGDVQTKKQVSF